MLLTLMSDDTRQGHTASADEYRRFVGLMLDHGLRQWRRAAAFAVHVPAAGEDGPEQHGGARGVTVIR
ncbi:hypothetical protein QBA75_00650 [Streptomyces stelliscabiei]